MAIGLVVRQVFDLPEPQPLVVTEPRAHECRCVSCGATTRAAFPEGVTAPVQYGARIVAFVIYLQHYQVLPEGRLVALMADLFSLRLCAASVANMSRSCANHLAGFALGIRDRVAGAAVKHMDETGFPRWRQDAVASCDVHEPAHLLPGLAPGVAVCSPISRASSFTITGSLTIPCKALNMRSATLTTFVN